MFWWWTASFLGLFGFALLLEAGIRIVRAASDRQELAQLRTVVDLTHELQESLEAGLVPDPDKWVALGRLPAPWGNLAEQSILELRQQGGSILPTLRRLRALASEHEESIRVARARSSQALAQAGVCLALVPLFGAALFCLLPGMDQQGWTWAAGCVCATVLAGAGGVWLFRMANEARWAGLTGERRSWLLLASCAGERFLSLVRTGHPADIAWSRCCQLLSSQAPELATAWGATVWAPPASFRCALPAATTVVSAGEALRKAVQVSVMEGRPCIERAEAVLAGLRQEMRAHTERELSLLATRALKPLFVCVAPALFGILAFGLYLAWESVRG